MDKNRLWIYQGEEKMMDIDAEIEMTKRKIQTSRSHIGRIELEQRLLDLQQRKRDKASWEL